MKWRLHDIRLEIENLSSIQVNDLTFDVVYFLGGDWKFLALVTGKLVREGGTDAYWLDLDSHGIHPNNLGRA